MFKSKKILLQNGQGGITCLLLASLALVVTGCTTENDLNAGGSTATAAKVTDIPQESDADYDNNVNGLITGNTLSKWIDNWTANRPAGITGKLVILQAAVGAAGTEYVKPDGTNVFTYAVDSSEWVQTRINGVIETISMVPDGRTMDTFLAKYNIDPANDMIVCTPSTASTSQVMRSGRCWYMFRYWGTAKEHLAQLNGSNDWVAANTTLDTTYFSATGSTPPGTGTASVADLPEVNMALQATVEDMMNIVPSQDINLLGDGVFIWDARGSNEYDPQGSDANYRNGGTIQGHPNGALDLNFSYILNDAAGGYSYKSKAEIQAYLNGEVDAGSNGFLDSTLQPVGSGNAYQDGDVVYSYCETTFRAMITGFASVAIMGKPTRFYDGAMIEWHALNNVVNSTGNAPLPWDSPWRTDLANVSFFETHSDAANQTPALLNIADPYATSANAIIVEDLAYKGVVTAGSSSSATTVTSSSSSSGGGGALPPNPCGG